MSQDDRSDDPARAELAALLPLRDTIARRASALREQLPEAEPQRRERLYSRALRCDRVMRLLDTRIRLAAEVLASGRIAPVATSARRAS